VWKSKLDWLVQNPNPTSTLDTCLFFKQIQIWVSILYFCKIIMWSLWFGFGKFPLKISNFTIFSLLVKKNIIGLGQKVPGSKTGQPPTYCGSKVCSGRVRAYLYFRGFMIKTWAGKSTRPGSYNMQALQGCRIPLNPEGQNAGVLKVGMQMFRMRSRIV